MAAGSHAETIQHNAMPRFLQCKDNASYEQNKTILHVFYKTAHIDATRR